MLCDRRVKPNQHFCEYLYIIPAAVLYLAEAGSNGVVDGLAGSVCVGRTPQYRPPHKRSRCLMLQCQEIRSSNDKAPRDMQLQNGGWVGLMSSLRKARLRARLIPPTHTNRGCRHKLNPTQAIGQLWRQNGNELATQEDGQTAPDMDALMALMFDVQDLCS